MITKNFHQLIYESFFKDLEDIVEKILNHPNDVKNKLAQFLILVDKKIIKKWKEFSGYDYFKTTKKDEILGNSDFIEEIIDYKNPSLLELTNIKELIFTSK